VAGSQDEQWGQPARLSLAVGVFASAVSLALFLYALSPIAAVLAAGLAIAAGVVGRERAATTFGSLLAGAALAGGVVAAIAAIALAAAGR